MNDASTHTVPNRSVPNRSVPNRSVPNRSGPTRSRVLFIGNDATSPQIAASLLRRSAGDRVDVVTVGAQRTQPGGRSDEMLVAMGLDPADEQPLSVRSLHTANRVVSLGAGMDVAQIAGPRYEEWDIAQGDLISRVEALSDDLTTVPSRPRKWREIAEKLANFGSLPPVSWKSPGALLKSVTLLLRFSGGGIRRRR